MRKRRRCQVPSMDTKRLKSSWNGPRGRNSQVSLQTLRTGSLSSRDPGSGWLLGARAEAAGQCAGSPLAPLPGASPRLWSSPAGGAAKGRGPSHPSRLPPPLLTLGESRLYKARRPTCTGRFGQPQRGTSARSELSTPCPPASPPVADL